MTALPTVRLSEVTIRIGSGITPRGGSMVYKTSGRPFVRSQNVGWGDLRLDDLAYIDDATHMGFPATEIRAGDILLNITGASIGRCAVATDQLDGGNVNQHVCEVRLNPAVMDPHYVNAVLGSRIGQDQIAAFQAGGNRQGLNFQQVGSIQIPVRDLHHQRAIGAVRKDVDAMISNLERLISKKQAMKEGAIERLLTGRIRLPGFTENWLETTLGASGTFLKGRGVKRDDVRASGIPCIRYGELYTAYNDYTSVARSFVDSDIASHALPIRFGDLLFAGSGETREEIGKCVAYTGRTPAVAGGDIVVLRSNLALINPVYLAVLANTPEVANQKARAGQGDAVVHINSRALAAIKVRLPPRSEQDATVSVVADANSEIRTLELRHRKALWIREGMMQELLTGRRRLGAIERQP